MTQYRDEDDRRQHEMVDNWMNSIRAKAISHATVDPRITDTPDWWKPEAGNPELEAAIWGCQMSGAALQELDGNNEAKPRVRDAILMTVGAILDVCLSVTYRTSRFRRHARASRGGGD